MSWTALQEQLALLPNYLGHHLLLTLLSLLVGIAFCLPLAVVITRVKSLQWPTLSFASVMQTIPGIALLALMVPLLGQIGFLPAFCALVLYSMLPILRNTVTGILGVSHSILEAADSLGMTSRQRLFQVELPLATPVIVAGVRTAAVWVVGTATLSTPVGATSLGNYIFGGLQTRNFTAVLVGCVAAAVLAIVLDQWIRVVEVAVTRRNRRLARAAGGGLFLAAVLAVLLAAGKQSLVSAEDPVVIGAKTFTEQYILAELLRQNLNEAGIPALTKPGMGSTILFDALRKNEVDTYIDYSGTLWTTVMKRSDLPQRNVLLEQMSIWLEDQHGIELVGPLGFENSYVLAMPRKLSEKLQVKSISDLTRHAQKLTMGSDYEFFSRPEWKALQSNYNLNFSQQRTFDPSLMYSAVGAGVVDVIPAYSTDGRIMEFDLVVLEDPKQALPPYDAVLLLSSEATNRPEVIESLRPLVRAIDVSTMRHANKLVDSDNYSIQRAAQFLRASQSDKSNSGGSRRQLE